MKTLKTFSEIKEMRFKNSDERYRLYGYRNL